jgi:hypothetical protein
MNKTCARLKKLKEWGIDAEFVRLNPELHQGLNPELPQWLNDLPPEMTVSYPAVGSPPWLSSPFIGNMHSYYYLSLILFYRPQLAFLEPTGVDGQWEQHVLVCYNACAGYRRLCCKHPISQGCSLCSVVSQPSCTPTLVYVGKSLSPAAIPL